VRTIPIYLMNVTSVQTIERIYLVNVKAFTERLKHANAQLARFGLAAEVIHDWDIVDWTAAVDQEFFNAGELSPAQKSCAMKHVVALQRIAAQNDGYGLVLEDDVVLSADFSEGVAAALAEAPQRPAPHVIFIDCGGNFYTPRSQRRAGQRLYPAQRGRFTDSYMITPDVAKLRLDWIVKHRISKPIDNLFEVMDRDLGITMLWLEDPVVEQGSKLGLFDTTIEEAHPGWFQRLLFTLEKFRRKYVYQIWR
jgi:glycosyl transferase family 25